MFRILGHTSDLEVMVDAGSFEELIKDSIAAVTSTVTDDVRETERRHTKFGFKSEEQVLMDILEEIVFLQSQGYYAKDAEVFIKDGELGLELVGGKAEAKDEIKAVTWHEFWVKEEKGKWVAHFICDL